MIDEMFSHVLKFILFQNVPECTTMHAKFEHGYMALQSGRKQPLQVLVFSPAGHAINLQ
jgi:hypothetical protein